MEHSGAHLNPAVTITLAVYRKIKPLQALKFVGAQMAGAFIAASLATVNNLDYINFLKNLETLSP
jgi:glycerol uptake facilitator-like aquaporin